MMITSAEELFSDSQAVTATAISENVMDLGTPGTVYGAAAAIERDIGDGTPIPMLVQVTTDFATLTSLTITLEHADNAALSTNNEVLWDSGAIVLANLTQGFQVPIRFLPKDITRRYLGLRYTVAGSNATAGAIWAGITAGNQS